MAPPFPASHPTGWNSFQMPEAPGPRDAPPGEAGMKGISVEMTVCAWNPGWEGAGR